MDLYVVEPHLLEINLLPILDGSLIINFVMYYSDLSDLHLVPNQSEWG